MTCVYKQVCINTKLLVTKIFILLSSKFDAGRQILFMLSSGITGVQIGKLIEVDGNEQPYQALSFP